MDWNQFHGVIFEHGVSLKRTDSGWLCTTADGEFSFNDISDVSKLLSFRPIMVTGQSGNAGIELVIPYTCGRFLDIFRSELSLHASRSVLFLMGACIYHLKGLILWSSRYCIDHAKDKYRPDRNKIVSSQETPFYQFEALINDVVRAFNILRYPMWKKWGTASGVPNSYERTIDRLESISDDLKKTLEDKRQILEVAKRYRDCIQHYVDIGSSSWVMLERLNSQIWSVLIRVPDNPECRSAKNFEFEQRIDALSLGWKYATALFETAAQIYGRKDLIYGPASNKRLFVPR